MNHTGDDLEDDFVIDDTVALSGDEGLETLLTTLDDEEAFVHLGSDDEGRDDEDDIFEQAELENNVSGPAVTTGATDKKRKRRQKEKERKAKKRKLAEAVEPVQGSIAAQASHELSNYLHSMQVKGFPKHSAVELDDLRIPESSIADTTQWTGPRTLDQLVDFISRTLPSLRLRLGQRSKSNGAPTLLYIAGAALRVADVCRVLKNKQLQGDKGGEVAKLFAKHIKLAQHVVYLKQTKIGAAVGTPGRLGKLLNETDVLNVSALSHIILDITHKDAKNRNLLEIPETRDEVFQTVLNNEGILRGIREGKIQVVLF
ncbi:U3-containing 90S pre-ribosomal complex subunit-domain containing protein [Gymnopilus junonius]|uniref:U3-containing 90S pre-ribosomal complex subunit-domain containing protein n=1 Tax=Gymnopilus junonius TaxID=109634 RepID=A0A9P5N8K4_GYMJU|nr:U3-containing 90S pre-ribosomal complex subunit-domain containing protein [Gymnopilus junonius]